MAVEGPVIGWVSDHRRHHAHADHDGDPHSPHGHGDGFAGTLHGLWHAHLGWLFDHPTAKDADKHAPDLLDDRGMRIVHKLFGPLVVARPADPVPGAAGASRASSPAGSPRCSGPGWCASSSCTT